MREQTECISRAVRCADRVLTNAYDRALSPSGLRTTQYTLLSVLKRQTVASIGELSQLLELDQTTTTRNVLLLEKSGLVVRVAHQDPRVKLLKLTAEGKRRQKLAKQHWHKMQETLKNSFGHEQWETFFSVLQKLETVTKQVGFKA